MKIRLYSADDTTMYDQYVRLHPHGSLWQSTERKHYIESCGKTTKMYVAEEGDRILATALVSIDKTLGGFSTWDIPRGPLWSSERKMHIEALMHRILADAKQDKCLQLFLSPQNPLPPTTCSLSASSRHLQPTATRILSLCLSEEEILAQMHQKGRYNITVAAKNGVTVRKGSVKDIDAFYALLTSTGSRDGFVISKKSHYARFLTDLRDSFILLAEVDGRPIAGLIGVMWNGTGIYYYGASSYEHRKLMAPYALQWAAMQLCKDAGCLRYDLLGISPDGAPAHDPWFGISDFKRKFGGSIVRYLPEQSVVLRPMMKRVLEWKRRLIG